MGMTTQLVTFGAAAIQLTPPAGLALVRRLMIEPLRSNTHGCVVGTSAVTNDASGVGVVSELAQPPAATVPVDKFVYQDDTGSNRIDPLDFYVHGTLNEKVKVSYWKV
jgi:hypothetical protein